MEESKFELWKKEFEEEFRKQQIKIDNLFSEIKKIKEQIEELKGGK